MAQISQNTISSTIALPPKEEGTRHHCKRWARFDVGRQQAGAFPALARVGGLGPALKHGVSLGNGRPPFWERPSRALPDPEDFSHASNAIRPPRAAVVNKTHQGIR